MKERVTYEQFICTEYHHPTEIRLNITMVLYEMESLNFELL